jgi:hypothetical protein
LTVKVCPPIVRLPLLGGPGFAATLNVMLLLPVPEPELVTSSQSNPDDAVHEHELPVVSVIVPAPPLASNAWFVGASV